MCVWWMLHCHPFYSLLSSALFVTFLFFCLKALIVTHRHKDTIYAFPRRKCESSPSSWWASAYSKRKSLHLPGNEIKILQPSFCLPWRQLDTAFEESLHFGHKRANTEQTNFSYTSFYFIEPLNLNRASYLALEMKTTLCLPLGTGKVGAKKHQKGEEAPEEISKNVHSLLGTCHNSRNPNLCTVLSSSETAAEASHLLQL